MRAKNKTSFEARVTNGAVPEQSKSFNFRPV